MKLDQTDKKIIQLLGADARMSNNQMAKVIGVTEGTVRNRIQKLIQNKVIKIDTANLDQISLSKLFLEAVSYTHLTLPTNREV